MKKWSVLLCLAFLWTTGYSKKKQEMVKDDRIWWCETPQLPMKFRQS